MRWVLVMGIANREVRATDGDQLIGQKSDTLWRWMFQSWILKVTQLNIVPLQVSMTFGHCQRCTSREGMERRRTAVEKDTSFGLIMHLWCTPMETIVTHCFDTMCQYLNNLLKLCNYGIVFLNYLPFKQLNFTPLIYYLTLWNMWKQILDHLDQ